MTVTLTEKPGKFDQKRQSCSHSSLSHLVFAEIPEGFRRFSTLFFLTHLFFQASSIHTTGIYRK
jgi:hypothetical protein